MRFLNFIFFHSVKLGRNVAHFFFRLISTLSFLGSLLIFSDYLTSYGFGSGTAWMLLGLSFTFSLLPTLYDKFLISLIPEGQTVYL